MEIKNRCSKCDNTGIIKKADRSVSICLDCLRNGNLDQSDKVVKESNIRG